MLILLYRTVCARQLCLASSPSTHRRDLDFDDTFDNATGDVFLLVSRDFELDPHGHERRITSVLSLSSVIITRR